METQRLTEAYDGLDDRRVFRLEAEPGNERAVDLDRLDRETFEVRQRRLAGAEVVNRQMQAEAAQVT